MIKYKYRDYQLKIYLDAERDCLVGEIDGANGDCDGDIVEV